MRSFACSVWTIYVHILELSQFIITTHTSNTDVTINSTTVFIFAIVIVKFIFDNIYLSAYLYGNILFVPDAPLCFLLSLSPSIIHTYRHVNACILYCDKLIFFQAVRLYRDNGSVVQFVTLSLFVLCVSRHPAISTRDSTIR